MVNPKLNDLLNVQFKNLCSFCERWTTSQCDECGEHVCEDCVDDHSQEDHYEDD